MNRLQVRRVGMVGRRAAVLALRAVLPVAFVTMAGLAVPDIAVASGPTPQPSVPQQLDHGQASGSARDFVTFGLQPAYPMGAPPRPTFTLLGDAGTQQRDNLRVSNFSQKPITLRIYAADARTAPDGGFEVAGTTAKPQDVGAWVRFLFLNHGSLTLPGRSRIDLPFIVAVPRNAEPGDHAGALVAAVTIASRDKGGALVNVESRVASRLYLRVGGILHPRLEVTNIHASYAGVLNPVGQGRVAISYTVRNTGNVRMAVDQAVRLSPQFWGPEVAVKGLRRIPEIVPGGVVMVTATAPAVWPLLRYSARIQLTPQPVRDAIAANTLNAHPAAGAVEFWAVPWMLLLILGLVIVVLAAFPWGRRWYRRRRPAGRHAKGPSPATPQRSKERVPALTRQNVRRGAIARAGLALVAVGMLCVGGAATAQAVGSADGVLTFTPDKGKDTTPMYLVTSKPCPGQATNVLATAYGHGFTADGQIVVSNSTSGMSHATPFVLPLQDTMAAYAKRLNIALSGPYKIVLICKSRLGMTPFASMVGTITFHTPHDYSAPAVTPAQAAAVTGQPGAPSNGQLPPVAGQAGPGAGSPSAPAGVSGGTKVPGATIAPRPGQPGSPGVAASPSPGVSTGALQPTSAAHSTSHAMWWLSGVGVLLLVFGVVLALRSVPGPTAPAATETIVEPTSERVS